MHNKINGKQEKKRFDPVSASAHYDRKEEFSDWPQALLAIGTFGTNGLKENQERCSSSEESKEDDDTLTMDSSENSDSLYELPNFTLEDVSSLHKELTKLLTLEPKACKDGLETSGERPNLPLNRFLNCPSSLSNNEEGDHLSPKSKIILSKAKDILTDNGTGIKRRSVKFLLKKLFACRSGIPPIPYNIRDPVPESKMEKGFDFERFWVADLRILVVNALCGGF
ncbi:hypothetical protein J5N97_006841 [Dioscorea zingiberensis]|uniref:Uncharacterized protein n=1 Tax=Dioscorea zingiberensis TaxID=325984 RepID=A0A9D5HT29_9LILI|nr:hypothetical protein J5N97_006841 [Dioscorea zingiberensis]